MERQKLELLVQIAQMTLDRDLADLRLRAAEKANTEARLADLTAEPVLSTLPLVAAQMAELRWQKWADLRRAEINPILARQTAEWMEARAKAQRAFARGEALRALRARLDQAS